MKPTPAAPKLTAKAPRARKPIRLVDHEYVVGLRGRVFLTLPLHTVSELNKRGREHWTKRHNRMQQQVTVTGNLIRTWAAFTKPVLPCEFKLIRIAPRKLDTHDNLRSSVKGCVDAIAKWMGVDDSDARLSFDYDQERGEPNTYGVRVEWTAT